MKRSIAAVLAALAFVTAGFSAAPMPDVLVKDTTKQILELLKANRPVYEKDHAKLYEMVYEHVLPHFDFKVMSRAVLGRYWREATDDQRKRFIQEFQNLLVRTYATALLKYTNEEIVYLPFNAGAAEKTATVKTEVKLSGGGPPVPINFSFYRSESGWRVYDLQIDGISLVANYQSTYASKIKSEGIDALIASMAQAKNDDSEAPVAGGKKGAAAKK